MSRAAVLTVLLAAISVAPAAAQDTGRLAGRVVRAGGLTGVEGVEVSIQETGQQAITDELGRFAFDSVPARAVTVEAHHIAYRTTEGVVEIHAGELVRIEIRVDDQVFDLDPVVVTARTRPLLMRERMGGFFIRQARGMGTFLDRDDLADRPVSKVTDVLREVHGLEIVAAGGPNKVLRASRYPEAGCQPLVYLNGVQLYHPVLQDLRPGAANPEAARIERENQREIVEILDGIPTDQVAGVEIYPGPGTVPGEFARLGANCGAIVVWTVDRLTHRAPTSEESAASASGLLGNRTLWFAAMSLGVLLIMLMPVL